MKLEALLSQIPTVLVDGPADREITSLCYDSRRAQPGSLFFALKGEKADGADYISAAVKQGAEAVVCEKGFAKSSATSIVVADARRAMADLAAHSTIIRPGR